MNSPQEKAVTTFKQALAATTRALAAKRQLTVGFGPAANADIALPPLNEIP